MEIKKIVWATDGSVEAQEALGYAEIIARKFSAEIVGLYVNTSDSKSAYSDLYHPKKTLISSLEDTEEKSFETEFEKIKRKEKSRGVKFTGKILKGDAASKIINYIHKENAELVVIGTRGHGLIDKMLIGSTTLKVLKKCKTPVLAYKKTEKKRAGIKNILVPVDVHSKDGPALEYAADLASVLGAKIELVYSIRMAGHLYAVPSLINDLLENSSIELAKRVEQLKHRRGLENKPPDLKIKTKVVHGLNPTVAIAEYAASKNIDLIVMSSHLKGPIKKFILGSTTENLILSSSCSTLVVK